eukprot:gene22592-biopygen22922
MGCMHRGDRAMSNGAPPRFKRMPSFADTHTDGQMTWSSDAAKDEVPSALSAAKNETFDASVSTSTPMGRRTESNGVWRAAGWPPAAETSPATLCHDARGCGPAESPVFSADAPKAKIPRAVS